MTEHAKTARSLTIHAGEHIVTIDDDGNIEGDIIAADKAYSFLDWGHGVVRALARLTRERDAALEKVKALEWLADENTKYRMMQRLSVTED